MPPPRPPSSATEEGAMCLVADPSCAFHTYVYVHIIVPVVSTVVGRVIFLILGLMLM